ncbi:hypothetical protein B0H16DRAFT_1459363 [Mycena metata]|uniref:Uncharacterized protein n=1 Tax=Mycena metata TaxID=1033252 RepID=A0AAD7IYW9_9AGAR|nr:hypothetical protein B0H16DRAFT_1459363 [Mycena metata]
MSLNFREGSLTPWVADSGTDGDVISASGRYFSMGRNIPKEARVPFNKKVDPANVQTKLLSKDLVHCRDNEVHYVQGKDNDKLLLTLIHMVLNKNPGFRIGDVVELGVCVTTFKLGDAKHMTKLVLRYMAFLDGHVTQAAFKIGVAARANSRVGPVTTNVFKRQFLFVEPDSDFPTLAPTTTDKFARLTVGRRSTDGCLNRYFPVENRRAEDLTKVPSSPPSRICHQSGILSVLLANRGIQHLRSSCSVQHLVQVAARTRELRTKWWWEAGNNAEQLTPQGPSQTNLNRPDF